MKKLITLLFCGFYTSAFAQKDFPAFEKSNFVLANDTIPYRLLKPQNYNPKQKYPLVIFFHGAGERGKDNIVPLTHIAPLFLDSMNRIKYPCFVLVPQCPKDTKWVDTDWTLLSHTQPVKISLALEMTMKILHKIEKDYSIDSNCLYVTGLSMGGFATWDIIARFPKKFACAVPVCGGGDEKTAEKIKNVPIWAFHGGLDKLVKTSRSQNMIQALQKAGSKPLYTEYPTVQHDSWKPAYKEPELLWWMFAQSLDKK